MARAQSVQEILDTKFEVIKWGEDWANAYDFPESSGAWLIWGNSGNGKTTFVMKLVRELAKHYKVHYNSLEEGGRLTMQQHLKRSEMKDVKRNVQIGRDTVVELSERLKKRKAPRVVVIDSVQAHKLRYNAYLDLKHEHRKTLFILISHAKGNNPRGTSAEDIKYDADMKIYVEGFRAISHGRMKVGGYYTIWAEGANNYHGTQNTQAQ